MIRNALRRISLSSRRAHHSQNPSTTSTSLTHRFLRRYSQHDRPHGASSSSITPATVTTTTIILTCCSVSLFAARTPTRTVYSSNRFGIPQRTSHNAFHANFVCSRENVAAGRWWVLLTHSFAHNGIPHLALNMLGVWQIGTRMIASFGVPTFAAVWVAAAVGGSAVQVYWPQLSRRLPRKLVETVESPLGLKSDHPSVGASASLCGMWAFLAVKTPSMYLQGLLITAAFDAGCMAFDVLPWIGHLAHLNGMVAGAAMAVVLGRRRRHPQIRH